MLSARDEAGFTLVELAVTMSIMLLVSGALLAALYSGTSAERRASTRIDDEQSVRLVLAQVTRDVRDADAFLPATNADQLDLDVGGSHIRWWYDSGAHVLTRYTFGTGVGTPQLNGVSVGNLGNAPGTTFALLGSDGSNLFALAGASRADALACAVSVGVSLTSQAHAPSVPFTETAAAPVHAVSDRRGCP